MQFIGHEGEEGRQEAHGSLQEQTPGPVGLHAFGLPAPSPVQYISVYEQHHQASSLFASIMIDVQQKEATRSLTSMEPCALDQSSESLLSPQDLQDLFDYLPGQGMHPNANLSGSRPDQAWWDHYCQTIAGGYGDPSGGVSCDGTGAASDVYKKPNELLDGLVNVCCKENAKMKKGLKRTSSSPPETKKISKKPCQNAKEAQLTAERIEDLYRDLLLHRLTAPEYGELIVNHAQMNEVSSACIVNILTCKSRQNDSCRFWPDALWRLYREKVRCEECRKLDYACKTLCQHHNKGRPFKLKESDAPPLPESSKMIPLLDESGKPKKLKREYKIHLTLADVWESFGCKRAKVSGTTANKAAGPAIEYQVHGP